MLKTNGIQRISTGLVLVIPTVSAVILLNGLGFSIVLGLVGVSACLEWCNLSRPNDRRVWNSAFFISVGIAIPILSMFPSTLSWLLGLSLIWWAGIAILLFTSMIRSCDPKLHARRWHAFPIIIPAAVALSVLHQSENDGRWYVTAFLLIVWTVDTTAYFVGRAWGRISLAPMISPGKTVEGVVGGFIGGLIIGLILYDIFPVSSIVSRGHWSFLVFLTVSLSVIGDLYESACKRSAGLKDSGFIFPGHGGILDRLDSVFASSPIFVAGLMYASR